jgi:hypothetical protein
MGINNQDVMAEIYRIEGLPLSPEDKAVMKESLFKRLETQQSLETSPVGKTFNHGKEVEYKVSPDPDTFRWMKPYTERFIPKFQAVKEFDKEYSLCNGEVAGIRLRKLVAADYAFLASLAPRAITHLKGNTEIFDPVTGEPSFLPVVAAVVSNALQEWDYDTYSPTGSALEILGAIVSIFRWREKDGRIHEPPFSIDDLLNSDPVEVIELVMGIYRANRDFFTRISTSNGTIHAVTTILGGIFGSITNKLKEIAAPLIPMAQELTMTTSPDADLSGSGGVKNGGKTSSSRSSRTRKATSQGITS